jgi:Kelch motif/Galactose oxidase, central domain
MNPKERAVIRNAGHVLDVKGWPSAGSWERGFLVIAILVLVFMPKVFAAKDHPPWILNNARYGAAVVSDGNALYVVGGANAGFLSLGGIERIDLATGQAVEMPVRIIPRRFHAAVKIGREIFIFGGEGVEGLIRSVEAVNLDTWKVRTVGKIPTPRRALSAIKVDSLVFTVGGSAPGDLENLPRTAVVEVYDAEMQRWFSAPQMPQPKETSAVVCGHFLYTLGGYNGSGRAVDTCERYDLSVGKWERLRPTPFTLSAYSAVDIGDVIVCFGDYEHQERVVAYQPQNGTWSLLDIQFTPRRHSSACVVGDWVYVVGGNRASKGQVTGIVERYSVRELIAAIGISKKPGVVKETRHDVGGLVPR